MKSKATKKDSVFYVYILKCNDGTFYTGYTNNLKKRVATHNGESGTATEKAASAKYTRGRRPVELIYSEKLLGKSEAMKREWEIKKMKRGDKLKIISC